MAKSLGKVIGMRLTISCAAFNNIKYTKLFVNSIVCSCPHEVFIVDNGSVDYTPNWLKEQGIKHTRYNENRGFSYAYNDCLDYALKDDDDLLLFCGNDIVFRPESIDFMVKAITESDYEMLCGNEVLNKEILTENKDALANFKYKFSFDEKQYTELKYSQGGMNHSCLVRKKSAFDKVGYYDVNFYPAYFEDNDYARRCDLLGVKYGTVESAVFYHFWSRSIHEGGLKQLNDRRFTHNRAYYAHKWGGLVGKETYDLPFGNGELKIDSRYYEQNLLAELGVIQ